MNFFKKILKNLLFYTSIFLICLSFMLFLIPLGINKTVLNSDFHKYLFEKHDIYFHAQNAIENYKDDFFEYLSSVSTYTPEEEDNILNILENFTTPQMTQMNLSLFREDLFRYFYNETDSLPDIHININLYDQDLNKFSEETLYKVNLRTILLYLNRTDISDNILFIKFLYYLLNTLPFFGFALITTLILMKLFFYKSLYRVIYALRNSFIILTILNMLLGVSLRLYSSFVLPHNIYPLNLSILLPPDVILSYIQNCISSMSNFFLIISFIFCTLTIIVFISNKKSFNFLNTNYISFSRKASATQKYITLATYMLCVAVLISVITYRFKDISEDFKYNNFNYVISRFTRSNTFTEVIPAEDETIYTLHVRILEKETSEPVENIEFKVSGTASKTGEKINIEAITDETGSISLNLVNGNFLLNFLLDKFPPIYEIPSSVFLDFKKPGIQITTIYLEKIDVTDETSWGIVEIQVLDLNNTPIEGVQLELHGILEHEDFPNEFFSITNSRGFAVFNINTGNYFVSFTEHSFPDNYILPEPFKVISKPDFITRYTLQLVDY